MFFFFSSRRRHTRYWRDWSSDVCSSDLFASIARNMNFRDATFGGSINLEGAAVAQALQLVGARITQHANLYQARMTHLRSEERRVGKECRSRWSPYH